MVRRELVVAAIVISAAAIIAALWLALGVARGDAPAYVPSDPALRRRDLYLYPPLPATRPPRAFIFFFGNDIGFWRAHRQLAADLAERGYAVAGFDMRPLLGVLPDGRHARDSAFLAGITPLVLRARRELTRRARSAADTGVGVPIVLAGHSLGAEVALWTAAYGRFPEIAGVLALSPGARSHLRVSASDLLMTAEPTGPLSFSVAETIARATARPRAGRVAIVRGSHDKLRAADSALVGAGGTRARLFIVPLAGHSLREVTLARFVVRRALAWLTAPARERTAP